MPIIIDARETRPEVLELAARARRAEARRRPGAALAAFIRRLRRFLRARRARALEDLRF